jgi:hypothetical protein
VTILQLSALWVRILDEQYGNEEERIWQAALPVLLQEAQQ